ncbi:hypothetical protein CO180_04425 [candidate division WWE3 bacterium CG_4_9_14_3_um_filter_41_6]|uniref:Uncharacterized protein n=1 Tax=candidate division WWE3 bacterium CG_4_10_14_0_2_um_filter_41_14 TaxID=1975072 RepID=A0A2M7TF69_UNCKA|nr:MAG: hypothetical protein COY32_06340 [candidate division WWE3 bacterium CG_4_10_14_0_2_um_filter_41_14]PJA38039.1 MAG: hypothetical protein CO180_04425 [candidate division WWE3 bacterium CG_4_9_14_3_um_filter_41_6]
MEGKESSKPLVLSNLTKFYGTQKGIENVNLDVEKGEVFGVNYSFIAVLFFGGLMFTPLSLYVFNRRDIGV